MRSIGLGLLSLACACFGDPPEVGDEGGSEGSQQVCERDEAPAGCFDGFANGSFDDWNPGLPFPEAWTLSLGTQARVDEGDSECPPAIAITAAPPREDGVVWEFGTMLSGIPVELDATATFVARMRRVSGGVSSPRICFAADPYSLCEEVFGYSDDGWVTVTAEVAHEELVTLHNFGISSYEVDQEVQLDEMHLWVCPPE